MQTKNINAERQPNSNNSNDNKWTEKTLLMVQQHKVRQNLIIPSNELQSSNNSALEYDAPPLPPRSAVIFTSMSSAPKVQEYEFLEKQQLPLVESVNVIKNFDSAANSIPGSIGQTVKEKLVQTLSKNKVFQTLQKISTILSGGQDSNFEIDPAIIPKFKYAPTTSVDVERSFSA